jgi:hypothetical protein
MQTFSCANLIFFVLSFAIIAFMMSDPFDSSECHQRPQEERATQNPEQQQQLQEEWEDLLRRYRHALRFVAGTGSRGQHYIDAAHNDLVSFAQMHPSPDRTPPPKFINDSDGTDGLATGLAAFAMEYHRRGQEDCTIS